MFGLALEADELLNEAIMSDTPILIVEGVDDIQVYEELARKINKSVEVYAAENIDGITEGCRGVIGCIDKIRNSSGGMNIDPYILGIIDRDSRYYRNEVPEDSAILMLEWYSMESHFVTKKATELVIKTLTRASGRLLSDDLINQVHSTIQEHLFDLYLISLEALKNSCEEEYESILGYSQSIGEIRGRNLELLVKDKEDELAEFARDKGIEKSWNDLLKVCKGKWLFFDYCVQLKKHISLLKGMCEISVVHQCQYCANQAFDKCLYKVKSNFHESQIQELISSNISSGDFGYIENRVAKMI